MEVLFTSKKLGVLSFGATEYKVADKLNEDYNIVVSTGEKKPTKFKSKLDKEITVYYVGIPDGEQVVKTKNEAKLRNLTEKLSRDIVNGKSVYIYGYRTAAYVACIVWFWLELKPKFDPIIELKKRGMFQYLQDKEQRIHIKKLSGQIRKTMYWTKQIRKN